MTTRNGPARASGGSLRVKARVVNRSGFASGAVPSTGRASTRRGGLSWKHRQRSSSPPLPHRRDRDTERIPSAGEVDPGTPISGHGCRLESWWLVSSGGSTTVSPSASPLRKTPQSPRKRSSPCPVPRNPTRNTRSESSTTSRAIPSAVSSATFWAYWMTSTGSGSSRR